MVLKNRNQGSYLPSLRLLLNVEVNVNVTDGQITRFKLLDALPLCSAEPPGLADIKCPNITLRDDAKGFTPFVDRWISVSIEPGVRHCRWTDSFKLHSLHVLTFAAIPS
jgi:hypothetical protein